MAYIKAGQDANGKDINLSYEDWGQGNPVVLIHGWPLSKEMWEYQMLELPRHGVRVIAYDRRGFGKSSKPWNGYDYDTLADDLKAVLDELDLQNVTLVGFSMGGGEVARYMNRHNGARVAKVAFVSAVTPFMVKTDNNPSGVDKSTFDDMIDGLKKDRADFLSGFGKKFYGDTMVTNPVSSAWEQWMLTLAMFGSPKATVDCVYAFAATDFRNDLKAINVPTLIVHGKSDKIVPIETGGDETAKHLPQAEYLKYDGAPHGLVVTDKDQFNQDLLAFVGVGAPAATPATTY